MSFLKNINGMLGNASEVSQSEVEQEIYPLLIQEEEIVRAYKLIRDLVVFTNLRLIIVDKQGVTGKRTSYHSIPYKNIRHFSVQSAGNMDLNSELFLYVSGSELPITKTFSNKININDIQVLLAHYTL